MIIVSNLNLPLRLLFDLIITINNNLSLRICCENIVDNISLLKIRLRSAYFAETENFFAESIVNKCKS